ncbi:MAG TPA: acyl-CoA dehydrogenase family protein [Candidatus Limnocylindrales bacterium]|nr:acyl-CoA dehydrogenase family protein [Candidatus Limnocylindrales bacterium]
MVSFQLTEEQLAMQKMAREFAEKEIIPVAAEFDEKEEIPWHVVEKAHHCGLMNLSVPTEYGGQGIDALTAAIIGEELAYGCLGINGTYGANELALTPILIAATEEQKKEFLPEFCSKPQLAAFGLTEPEAGSDVANIQSTAVRDGDSYLLNGTKCFITNGGVASLYTIFASVDKSKGFRGMTAFIVPGDTPGLSQGKKEKKLGDRASHVAEIVLDNVRVPAINRLGNEGDGFKIAMMTLDTTRPGIGATAVGLARRAFEEARKYSMQRVQFGKPIAANQIIQFMLADMAMKIDAARLLVWRSAQLLALGKKVSLEGSMAKCYAADVAMEVAVDAVQIMGGSGYMREYPVEKLMRDAKILQIYEGTNQIQRIVIARNLLA